MAEDEGKKLDTKEEKDSSSEEVVIVEAEVVEDKEKKKAADEKTPKEEKEEKVAKPKRKVRKKKATVEVEEAEKEVEAERPKKKVAKKRIKVEEKEEVEKPKVKAEKELMKEKEKVEKKEEEKEGEKEEEEAEGEEGEEEEEKEEIEIIEEEEEYKVKIKPELSDELKHELEIRRGIKKKTPEFRRQEWFRYKRLGEAWRRPRGLHSKMRKHKGYRQNVVSAGYGSPKGARDLHPSGFEEVMVYNAEDLDKIDPKSQAARVGHSVGTRKRMEIEEKAEEKGIRVLNPRRA